MTAKISLEKLHAHLGNFTPDTANMIKLYYAKTTLKIGLIFVMMDIRDRLEHERNPELNKNFKLLKADFAAHVRKKIEEGTTDEEDLLFEIDEVRKFNLIQAKETVIKDIENSGLEDSKKRKLLESLQ
jgi:hypothetical protein